MGFSRIPWGLLTILYLKIKIREGKLINIHELTVLCGLSNIFHLCESFLLWRNLRCHDFR